MDRAPREAPETLIVILDGHSARAFVLVDSTRTASWSATTAPPPFRGAAIGLPQTILLTALAECKVEDSAAFDGSSLTDSVVSFFIHDGW